MVQNTQNHRRGNENTHLNRFSGTFIIGVMIMLTLLPLVSAFDWTSSIYSYWDFDEGSGTTINDSLGKQNFTVNGANWTDGRINSGYILQGVTESQKIINPTGNSSLTINVWINTSQSGIAQDIFGNRNAGALDDEGEFILQIATGGQMTYILYHNGGTLDLDGGLSLQNNIGFQMYTVTFNVTTASFYANGTLIDNESLTGGGVGFPNRWINLSMDNEPSEPAENMTFDELGIWTKSLTPLEIVELYNLGKGLTYLSAGDGTITLTNPIDTFSVIEQTPIDFNCSANTGEFNVTNISLFIDGARNITQDGTGTNFSELTTTLTLPSKSYNWTCKAVNSNNISITTTNRTLTINPMVFGLCNSTLSDIYLNVSFKNESGANLFTNASIPTSTWWYWLGDQDQNRTFTFVNTTENPEYDFCFSPKDSSVNVSYSLSYTNTESQQRNSKQRLELSNSTTNQTLWLLPTSEGLFVTFQVINVAEQVIANVIANVTREIDGITTLLGSGLTDAAGSVTFWLNPNFLQLFTFFKTGFPISIQSITPTQTSYTITLGSLTTTPPNDTTQGINYKINPNQVVLFNQTSYVFNFTLASSYWTVEEFGFVLRNTTNQLGSDNSTTNGGTTSFTLNVQNNTEIIMDYFWVINGNYTNSSTSWKVLSSAGTDWSIKIFFSDLTTYITSGMFGMDNFALALLTFLTIFIFTGIMSYKFGLVSPAGIATLAFSLTLFFDVGLGLMDSLNPFNAVPHFPSIFMGVILAGIFVKEAITR